MRPPSLPVAIALLVLVLTTIAVVPMLNPTVRPRVVLDYQPSSVAKTTAITGVIVEDPLPMPAPYNGGLISILVRLRVSKEETRDYVCLGAKSDGFSKGDTVIVHSSEIRVSGRPGFGKFVPLKIVERIHTKRF